MGEFSFSDMELPVLNAGNFSFGGAGPVSETFNPGYTPAGASGGAGDEFSFEGGASGARGSAPAPGGGGWFDRFGDFAERLGGGAAKGVSALGDLAKVASPIAGVGSGIMGIIAQRQAAQRAAQQQPMIDESRKVQLENAQQARPYAAEAAGLAPKVESVAPKLDAVASKVAAQTGQPVVDYATQTLEKVRAGEIPDAYQAQIENWRQAAKAKVLDYLARSGQADSSARVQLEAWVDQQAQAMAAGILGQEEQRALGAFDQGRAAYGTESDILSREASVYGAASQPLGTAGSILTGSSGSAQQVASSVAAEEQSIEELIANANKILSRVAAGAA